MTNNKARQPNRAAPPVPLRNDKTTIYQRTDNTRSKQHVNEMQRHLLFDACKVTQVAVWAVCNPQNYQGTWNTLIHLAGCINAVTEHTFISSEKLAERIGVERDTTDAQLLRLQDAGIVTIQGKQGRSYKRSIMLPCSHLDMNAESIAGSHADSSADSSADSNADTYADTSPHYQNRTGTEQDQQQRDSAAGYSQAEKQAFIAELNDLLPAPKRIEFNSRIDAALDSAADNAMPLGLVIDLVHRKAKDYLKAGGIVKAIEIEIDDYAARAPERTPKRQLVPCTGLADVECKNGWHTTIGDRDAPVQQCPQRKAAS